MANQEREPYVLNYPNGQRVADILKKADADYSKAEIDAKMAQKATTSDVERETQSLQNQINEIVRAPESGGDVGAEVAQARVDADGITHGTLKARLDNDQSRVTELKETLDDGIKSIATDLHYPLKVRVADIENLYDTVEVGAYYKPTEGDILDDLTIVNTSTTNKLRTVVIDVSMGGIISFPVVNGTEFPVFFLNANNEVIRVHAQTEISSGTIVELDVPDGAVGFAFVFNTEWELSMRGFVTIKITELTSESIVAKIGTINVEKPINNWDYASYRNVNGQVGSKVDLTPVGINTYNTMIVPVFAGDVFKVTGYGGMHSLWAFLDDNEILLSKAAPYETVTDKELTAEANGYLVINVHYSTDYAVSRVYNTVGTAIDAVDAIIAETGRKNLDDAVTSMATELHCPLKVKVSDIPSVYDDVKKGAYEKFELGDTLDELTFTNNSYTYKLRTALIDVSMGGIVSFPVMKGTAFPFFFLDANNKVICIYMQEELSSGTIVEVSIPVGATKFAFVYNTRQDNVMRSFLTVKPYANKNKDSIISVVMQKSLYTKYDYFDLSELFNYPKYGEGKLLEIGTCMGMTFADAINDYTGDVRNDIYYLKMDVSEYQHIYCPSIRSTTGKDGLFVNKDEVIIGSMPNSTENRVIWCAVPTGAKYIYWPINVTWEEDIFFVGLYSSLTNFIGSGGQGTAYPRLSDNEKEQILTLCDEYYNNRDRFTYFGSTRDSYAGQSCFKTVDGEKYFDLVCSTFAQFIWMGRSISDFNIDNYTPDITKEFNWGYYFEFLLAQRTYGVKKPDGTRYGMSADGLYSYNSYGTSENNQSNMHLLTASDMAQELYTFGFEIPRSQLDVGDLVFYRHPTYDDMGLQCQLQFRNISHVAVVVDTNYQNSGYMLTIECLSGEDPCIVKQSVIMADNQRALRAAFYEKRIVMCARHPHAFGKGGNVPSKITTTRGKLV